MSGPPWSVMIVDDHPMVRQGLRAFLAQSDEVRLVGEAEDLQAAVDAARRLAPDVVLLDLVLPGVRGAQAVTALREASPASRILVLTSFGEPARALDAVQAGAAGYLLKTVAPDDLLASVRQVASGRSVLDPEAMQAATRRKVHLPTGEHLTAREQEVLRLISEGLDNRAISMRLHIAEKTVKVHVGRIYQKLGAQGRAQALVLAARAGIVSLSPPHGSE